MNTIQKGIITLLKSAVTGEAYPMPEGFSLKEADEIIRRQSLLPLIFQGALNCGLSDETEIMQRYQMQYYRYLLKSERQMRSVEQIFQAFEENGINYMPLKGCIMKKLYPWPELRTMGDADILIHPEEHEQIRMIMEKLGFSFRAENEHVFEWKSDSLFVELHKSLVPIADEEYYEYYGTGWKFAQKQNGCRFDLSAEDTFVFLFTHFARHYRASGIGCRHVVDLYVYHRAFPDLNQGYLKKELEKLHLKEFYGNTMRLLDVWFCDAQTSDVIELMTSFIFSGGNWGSMEAGVWADAVRASRKSNSTANSGPKAIARAIFPPKSSLAYRYTVLVKHPWLLPVIWVVRWIDILVFRPQKIRKRISIIRTINDDEVLCHQQALRAVGLDFYFGSNSKAQK